MELEKVSVDDAEEKTGVTVEAMCYPSNCAPQLPCGPECQPYMECRPTTGK